LEQELRAYELKFLEREAEATIPTTCTSNEVTTDLMQREIAIA
jgi:hypothetical protein